MKLLLTLLFLFGAVHSVPIRNENSAVECNTESCYKHPLDCHPETDCEYLMTFDKANNINMYLFNFADHHAFASFPIGHDQKDVNEYLLCLPHSQQQFRLKSVVGGIVEVTKNLTRRIRKTGQNDFVCSFESSEITNKFREEVNFSISSGTFSDFLVMPEGKQMYSLQSTSDEDGETYDDDDEDHVSLVETGIPVSRSTISDEQSEGDDALPLRKNVFTKKESAAASEAIKSIGKIAEKKGDTDFEKDVRKTLSRKTSIHDDDNENSEESDGGRFVDRKSSRSQSAEEEDEEDENQEEVVDRRKNSKKNRQNQQEDDEENDDDEKSRKNKKTKSRPSRYEDNDDEEDDEDFEEKSSKKSKKNNRSSKRQDDEDANDEEDDANSYEEDDSNSKKRKNQKKTKSGKRNSDETDYEDDEKPKKKRKNDDEGDESEEMDDDEYDDDNGSFSTGLSMTSILTIAFTGFFILNHLNPMHFI